MELWDRDQLESCDREFLDSVALDRMVKKQLFSRVALRPEAYLYRCMYTCKRLRARDRALDPVYEVAAVYEVIEADNIGCTIGLSS